MRIKRIIIPTITMVIIASQLFGCSCSSQSELHKMIERGDQIEIEVPEPNFEEQGTETKITWVELAKLMTYASYRTGVDNAFQITSDGISKYGVIYVDSQGNQTGNATLYDAFMNKTFVEQYWNNDNIQNQLADGISTVYTDLEESDTQAAIINAYWNLLPDNEPNFFNGGASLSRAEAMTLIMRATTPVETLKSHEDFISAVGESDYAGYANYVVGNSYLNTSDKSLNNQTFNGTMTRGEYIYLLVANTFGIDSINNVEIGNVKLNDCKDGGNIAKAQKFSGKDYCKSYELVYALQNPDDGAPTSMYKAIVKANQLGIINAETAWDEAITRTDAIDLFISAIQAKAKLDGYAIEQESGKLTDNSDKAKELYNSNKNGWICDEATFINKYNGYVAQGLTEEQLKHQLTVEFSVDYNEEPTTEKPTEQATEPTEQATEKPMTLQERYRSFPTGWTQWGSDPIFGKVWYYVTPDRTVYEVFEEHKSLFDTNNIKKSVEQGYGKEVYRELPEETEKQTTSKPQQTTEKPTEKPQQQTTQQTTSSSSENNQEEETTEYQFFDPTKGDVGPSGGYDPNKQ